MNILKKYTIAHKGLSIGIHNFEFKINDAFFKAFEGSEILGGNLNADVQLNRMSTMLTLDITITGNVKVECDRCLEELELPIDVKQTLQIKFSETESESDGDIMWISPNETELNLGQYIYETICLSLPYQRAHPIDENGESMCNQDMLTRFLIVEENE